MRKLTLLTLLSMLGVLILAPASSTLAQQPDEPCPWAGDAFTHSYSHGYVHGYVHRYVHGDPYGHCHRRQFRHCLRLRHGTPEHGRCVVLSRSHRCSRAAGRLGSYDGGYRAPELAALTSCAL